MCHACVAARRSRRDRDLGFRARPAVQATLLLVFLLPPPAASPLMLARLHGACAGRAADREETFIVQCVVWDAVVVDEGDHALTGPVEERIELDQAARVVDRRIEHSRALP